MQWLLFTLFLDLSYFPSSAVIMYQYENIADYSNTYCAELGLRAELFNKWVFVEASNYCSFNYSNDFDFHPNIENYKFGIGIQAFNFLKVGYEHSCFHPVLAYMPIHKNELKQTFEGYYDRFYVRVETKFNIGGKDK